MLSLGMSGSYSVFAIPALLGKDLRNNADEFLRVTGDEVSWLGNASYHSTKYRPVRQSKRDINFA